MISRPEMAAAIAGAFRLARRDPRGLALFDTTPRGFWNSFWAAVLVAPAFILSDLLGSSVPPEIGPREILVWLISYVVAWTAFPVVMITVADSLDRWPLYTRYIVAYNWSSVVQVAVLLPLNILAAVFPSPATHTLVACAIIVLLIYYVYVAYVGLAVNPGTAAGVVLLDVLLSQLVRLVSDRLMGM